MCQLFIILWWQVAVIAGTNTSTRRRYDCTYIYQSQYKYNATCATPSCNHIDASHADYTCICSQLNLRGSAVTAAADRHVNQPSRMGGTFHKYLTVQSSQLQLITHADYSFASYSLTKMAAGAEDGIVGLADVVCRVRRRAASRCESAIAFLG